MQNYHYAQIDIETGLVIGDSWLSGEVDTPNMVLIPEDFEPLGMMYVNGEWLQQPKQPEPIYEPTEQELIQAEILLNQADILAKQAEQDEVLAEILLNQMGV